MTTGQLCSGQWLLVSYVVVTQVLTNQCLGHLAADLLPPLQTEGGTYVRYHGTLAYFDRASNGRRALRVFRPFDVVEHFNEHAVICAGRPERQRPRLQVVEYLGRGLDREFWKGGGQNIQG